MSLLQIIISIFVGILMAGGLFSINLAVRGIDRKFNLYYFLIVTGMSLFLILSLISYYVTEINDFIFVEKAINVVLLLSCLVLILLVQEISNYRNKNIFLLLTVPLILFLIVNLVALISACIFFRAGLDATIMYFNLGQVMEIEISIPIWWMFLAFPVGFMILALTSLELLFDNIINLIKN